jgi:thymidylate synthase
MSVIPVFHSLSEAYLYILKDVYENPDYVHDSVTPEMVADSDNKVTKNPNWFFNKAAKQEKVNYHFVIIKPRLDENITTKSSQRNDIIYEYSSKETVLFDSGDRTAIKSLSKVWDRIQNPDGTINANYGYMVYFLKDAGHTGFDPENFMSQWDWAKNRLKLKKSTNQGYLHFNRPKDQWNENLDQPCCMNIQFFIREDQLHLNVNMRSNDITYGCPYNLLYFVKLMHRMVEELKGTYPTLTIGNYYYNTLSLHFYLKHKSKVEDMLGLGPVQ